MAEFQSTKDAQAFRTELYEFARFWEPAPDDPVREYAEGVADEIMAFDPERGQGTGEFRSHVIDTILRHVRHGNDVVDRIAEMGGVRITNRAVSIPTIRDMSMSLPDGDSITKGPGDAEWVHNSQSQQSGHLWSQCSREFCGRQPWGATTEPPVPMTSDWIWRSPDDTEFQHYRRGQSPHPTTRCSTEFCGRERNQGPEA